MDYTENFEKLCKKWEGCELKAYKDAAGVWTIAYGHTGDDVYEGLEITQAQADALFEKDAAKHCKALNKRLDLLGIALNQNRFDAVLDMVYNLGVDMVLPVNKKDKPSTFCGALCAGNYAKAAEYMLTFNKITDPKTGKKVEKKGLTNRRKAERELFVKEA